MVTKLTLTMEKEVIEKAKAYAKESGRSLSSILENYLKSLTKTQKYKNSENPDLKVSEDSLTYQIMQLSKGKKIPKDFDYDKAKEEFFKEKYKL